MTESNSTSTAASRRARPATRWLAGALAAGILIGLGGQALAQTFPDVPPGRFYSAAVEWAFSNGITTGFGDTGEFRPDEPVTRGQMVTFLHRFEDHVAKLGVAGPKGDPGPKGEPGQPATSLWATVNVVGDLARGRGVVSSTRLDTGDYEVVFNRNVRQCAHIAGIGLDEAGNPLTGGVSTAYLAGNVNGVRVTTTNGTNGALADRGFHLAVFC